MNDFCSLFMNLFPENFLPQKEPLAMRMRPQTLKEVVGQTHVLFENSPLLQWVKKKTLGSLLLFGPPGCGKTTIAEAIARELNYIFVKINAVLSNVSELKAALTEAKYRSTPTILFIDEIHRFNKAQQDLLLPDVESGAIHLIGATTHNPGFYVINPLMSRCQLIELEPIPPQDIKTLLQRALGDSVKGLASYQNNVHDSVLETIAKIVNGDARRALNLLESMVINSPVGSEIGDEIAQKFLLKQNVRYDADEDEHYNTISAYIKSMRGCDPDAALYWLAVMLEGGEDPLFIARRLIIFASEDIGLADSRALGLAVACYDACERIGLPECRINLAHVTTFFSLSSKSNSAYHGLSLAQEFIRKNGKEPVPMWLRDDGGVFSKKLGHQKGYLYSHDFKDNISGQTYMLTPKTFYFPKKNGAEHILAERHIQLKSESEKIDKITLNEDLN